MKRHFSFSSIVLMAIIVYSVYRFIESRLLVEHTYPTANTVLYIVNIFSALFLLRSYLYKRKVVNLGEQNVTPIDEDEKQIQMERNMYKFLDSAQIAFTVSLVSMVVGFLLMRDDYPKVPFCSFFLVVASFFAQSSYVSLMKYTRPDFQLPDPNRKDYQQKLFETLDDGERYIMLKSFYKLFNLTIYGLVLLLFILMFYSIFSDESQLFSIIAIGAILLFMQLFYLNGIKVKN